MNFLSSSRFTFKHLLVIIFIIILLEILLFFIFKYSFNSFLFNTQNWYQQNSAGRIANISATALELLIETTKDLENKSEEEEKMLISKFNVVFSQQLMEENVEDICLFVIHKGNTYLIDNGENMYDYFVNKRINDPAAAERHKVAASYFNEVRDSVIRKEGIITLNEESNLFHSFVPFVPDGEFLGVLYVRNRLDFSDVTNRFTSNYDEITVIFTSIIFLGLLALYKITSHTVKVRDAAQKLYYEEHNRLMLERIEHDKEFLFTKRIYHANHKAEKIMGFIQQDISAIKGNEDIKNRVFKYANFISRVIYDMKWYDPPIHSIRNQIYVTDINEVIRFITANVFERLSVKSAGHTIVLALDPKVPVIHINEFVIWEIIEPLVQNSITHNTRQRFIKITIETEYDAAAGVSEIRIRDDGKGIEAGLLEKNEQGIQKIFLENTTTNSGSGNYGYGCFIAYNMAKRRCGWDMKADNLADGGCEFTITINHK